MLIKLLKYDIRADYKKYAITAAVIILLSFAVRLADIKFGDDSSDWNALFNVLVWAYIMLCGAALIMVIVLSAVRYQKKMYTDEGYFLNTIPADPSLHILSTIITTFLWEYVIVAVDIVALIISAGGTTFWEGFSIPFRYMWELDQSFAAFSIGFTAIYPITMMLTLIFTINFAHLFRSHRVLAGIGGYVGLCLISQLLATVISFIAGKSNMNAATAKILYANSDYISSTESYRTLLREMARLSNGTYFSSIIANIIFFSALFIISAYILKKKINLD